MGDIKAGHRKMWAMGDYPALAADIIWDLGGVLARATGAGSGDRVLDIAAGSGNAAIAAARAGASVVASDLTPELLEAGRKEAARLDKSALFRLRMLFGKARKEAEEAAGG